MSTGKETERKSKRHMEKRSKKYAGKGSQECMERGSKMCTGKVRAAISGICMVLLCTMFFGGCGKQEPVNIRIGSLKGPTSMGLLFLMEKAEQGETSSDYAFQMATGVDELLPLMVKGEIGRAHV